ncbi:MAG TPA: hypothetical protein VMF05_14410 [Stellaceae bacterium]|nr:hypothetical protein [Stellaceae bacterium]
MAIASHNSSGSNRMAQMVKGLSTAVPLLIALAGPAAAQTAATPVIAGAGGAAAASGAVQLPGITATTGAAIPTTPAVTGTATSGTGTAGAAGSAGPHAANPVAAASTVASGGATPAATSSSSRASSVAPHWLLCPPSGASAGEPFLTGTDLSCAP